MTSPRDCLQLCNYAHKQYGTKLMETWFKQADAGKF